jgi:hypothetical protein
MDNLFANGSNQAGVSRLEPRRFVVLAGGLHSFAMILAEIGL